MVLLQRLGDEQRSNPGEVPGRLRVRVEERQARDQDVRDDGQHRQPFGTRAEHERGARGLAPAT